MGQVKTRLVYTTSDGKDFGSQTEAKLHERKIVISEYFIAHEKTVGEDDLGLTERQAQSLVSYLAEHIDAIHLKLGIDRLF